MNYTYTQLARISPRTYRWQVWRARASRLWKRYLGIATALAGLIGGAILTVMYFVLLPPFAWLAKRGARRETPGWTRIAGERRDTPTSQY
jgi:hypothetical protein